MKLDPRSIVADERRGWEPGALLLVALAAANTAFLGWHLRFASLALDDPFLGGDGGEWLSNGLALAGAAVRQTGRQPLLPLLLALLDRVRALGAAPALMASIHGALALTVYALARRVAGSWIACACGIAVLLGQVTQLMGIEIMADTLAATLLTLAVWAALGTSPRNRWLAWVLVALAGLAQLQALLLGGVAVGAAHLGSVERTAARRRLLEVLAGASLAVLPVLAWARIRAAAEVSNLVSQAGLDLLRTGISNVTWSAVLATGHASLAFWGWPAVILAALGLAAPWGEPATRRARATALAAAGAFWLFFGVAYGYRALRFAIYLAPAVTLGCAMVLARLPRRWVVGLAILAVGAATWPVAASLAITRWVVVPGLAIEQPDLEGSAPPPLARAVRFPAWASWRDAAPVAVARAWHEAGAGLDPISASRWRAAKAIVSLVPEGFGAGDRSRMQYGLGNALRKRVKMVPAALYPPTWPGWAWTRRAGEVRGIELWWWSPSGTRRWLIAVPHPPGVAIRSAAVRRADGRPLGADRSAPAPSTAALARRWRRALGVGAALDALTDGVDGILAAERGDLADEWLRLLPFATRTSSFLVLRSGEAPPRDRLLLRRAGIAAWASRYRGRPVVVIGASGAEPPAPTGSGPPSALVIRDNLAP